MLISVFTCSHGLLQCTEIRLSIYTCLDIAHRAEANYLYNVLKFLQYKYGTQNR
jgi:hypothetical protein